MMITKLTGILDEKLENTVTVDVNGVGYLVHASRKTIKLIPENSKNIVLFIDHIIRQDDQMLCGFIDKLERDWFRLLTSVQGVGTKVALSILSYLTVDEIAEAIARQASKPFTQADGVGAKVASRITLELKGKVPESQAFVEGLNSTSGRQGEKAVDDAISALVNLGYTKAEVAKAVQLARKQNQEVPMQDLIRLGLQLLSRRVS